VPQADVLLGPIAAVQVQLVWPGLISYDTARSGAAGADDERSKIVASVARPVDRVSDMPKSNLAADALGDKGKVKRMDDASDGKSSLDSPHSPKRYLSKEAGWLLII